MDIQFILYNDALYILSATEVPGLLPRSVQIEGPDFRSAIKVLINDLESPSFIIMSQQKILAQVPDNIGPAPVLNTQVLSSNFTASFRSKIFFEFGPKPQKTAGLRYLIQMYLRLLFTSPGSDAFAPQIGGFGLKAVGQNVEVGAASNVVSDFAIAVRRAEQQLRDLQNSQTKLADDERLLAATLQSVYMDPATTSLVARIQLIPQSGIPASVNVEL